ncbi:MAG: TIGR02757 family protein [Alistipes sp.]|nr:TIGR02757 family protein [Alistipes sp.]
MERYSDLSREELRDLLETLHDRYNRPEFIENDPISVPHSFSSRDDREVAGLLASTIAWGNRKAIVKSAHRMMQYMDNAPADFVRNASERELALLESYVHRTFNGRDFIDFVRGVRGMCERFGGIGNFVEERYEVTGSMAQVLSDFRREFFACDHNPHCEKHLSSIDKGAACKRLNMYFRWFVRRDERGVDFGEWRRVPMSALYLPLDVHTGNMGRALGLLSRRQSDWKATVEITESLREFDAEDPVRFDFSLFGAGIDGFLK